MKTSQWLSEKMTAMAFWAIVAVAVDHSRNFGARTPQIVVAIESYVSLGLTQWAVPFFFIVSGFWFGRSSWTGYWSVLKKKARTLLVPYLLWCLMGTLFTFILVALNNVLQHKAFLERMPFQNGNLWLMVDSIFGIVSPGPWGEGVLWFVRVLLMFFICAPLWRLLNRISSWLVLIVAGVLIFIPFDVGLPKYHIGFCLLGYWVSGLEVEKMSEFKKGRLPVTVIFGLVYMGLSYACPRYVWIAGIPFWWLAYDLAKFDSFEKSRVYCYTFWIFVTHQLIASYFMALWKCMFGYSSVSHLLLFVLTPFVSVGGFLLAGYFVCRHWPKAYNTLVGGRMR